MTHKKVCGAQKRTGKEIHGADVERSIAIRRLSSKLGRPCSKAYSESSRPGSLAWQSSLPYCQPELMFLLINIPLLQEAQPEHSSRHQLLLQWQVRGDGTASINIYYMQRILGLPLHTMAMTLHRTVGLPVGHAPPLQSLLCWQNVLYTV